MNDVACPICAAIPLPMDPACPICQGRGRTTQRAITRYQLSRSWTADEIQYVCIACAATYRAGVPWAPTSHGFCDRCAPSYLG